MLQVGTGLEKAGVFFENYFTKIEVIFKVIKIEQPWFSINSVHTAVLFGLFYWCWFQSLVPLLIL